MLELFANNAHGTIAAPGLTNVATTLDLDPGQGSVFPSPGSGEFFRLDIEDVGLTTFESVYCTLRATDTLTISRGEDGSSASAFAAGSRVRLRPTAAMLRSILGTVATETPLPLSAWGGVTGVTYQDWGGRMLNHAGTLSASGVSSGSMQASLPGLINTSTIATQIVGSYFGLNNVRVWRGNGTNRGGFDVWLAFALPANLASTFYFVGLDDDNNVYLTTNPPGLRTTTGQLCFGFDTSSGTGSNWQLFHSSGSSGSVDSLDTGFVRNATDAFLARFYALPNAGTVQATLYNVASGDVYDHTISTNLPLSTAFLVSRNVASGVIGAQSKTFAMWRFPVNQSEPTV